MSIHRIILVMAFASMVSGPLTAQQSSSSRWKPAELQFDLSNVAVAAMSKDGQSVRFIYPVYALEQRTRTITVTKTKTETRTRTVNTGNGTIEEPYTVEVPYAETIEQSYTVRVPGSSDLRFDLALNKVFAWEVSGKALNAGELANRLKSPAHVLVLASDYKPQEYFKEVLHPQLIVLRIPPGTVEIARNGTPPNAPFAPFAPAAPTAPTAPVVPK